MRSPSIGVATSCPDIQDKDIRIFVSDILVDLSRHQRQKQSRILDFLEKLSNAID